MGSIQKLLQKWPIGRSFHKWRVTNIGKSQETFATEDFFKDKQNHTRPAVRHAFFMTNALLFIWSALCTFLCMFLNEKQRRKHSFSLFFKVFIILGVVIPCIFLLVTAVFDRNSSRNWKLDFCNCSCSADIHFYTFLSCFCLFFYAFLFAYFTLFLRVPLRNMSNCVPQVQHHNRYMACLLSSWGALVTTTATANLIGRVRVRKK